MRVWELTHVAGQAQLLLFRAMLRRQLIRVGEAAAAVILLLAAFALLELTAVVALEPAVGLLFATILVALANAAIAGVLLWLASSNVPGEDEKEALKVRREALASLKTSVTVGSALKMGLGAFRYYRRRAKTLPAKRQARVKSRWQTWI